MYYNFYDGTQMRHSSVNVKQCNMYYLIFMVFKQNGKKRKSRENIRGIYALKAKTVDERDGVDT